MSIYGDVTLHFQEQFQTVPIFNMTPKIGAGFDIVAGSTSNIKVILHNITPNQVTDINGNLVLTASFEVWTRSALNNGWFIKVTDDQENAVYRLQKSNDWYRLGGFYAYNAIMVVGDDGQLTNDVEPNLGEGNFR